MATRFIRCYKCQKEYTASWEKPFKVICNRCGTIIGSYTGKDIWYDLNNYNQNWSGKEIQPTVQSEDTSTRFVLYIFGGAIGIVLLSVVYLSIKSVGEFLNGDPETNTTEVAAMTPRTSLPTDTFSRRDTSAVSYSYPDSEPKEAIEVYSGQCTYSEKELNGNLMTLKPISSGFAKVVINRKLKKLYFYYNNKLVFHYFNYSSYTDDIEGGEGFNFDSDADAHRFIAERVFQLNTERIMGGQLGYQYEISNYQEH